MRILLAKNDRIAAALERIAATLDRIADAAFPPLPASPPSRPAQLSDLRRLSPSMIQSIQAAEAEFAKSWNVVPGSDAFLRKKLAFEEELNSTEEGRKLLSDLPWRRLGKV